MAVWNQGNNTLIHNYIFLTKISQMPLFEKKYIPRYTKVPSPVILALDTLFFTRAQTYWHTKNDMTYAVWRNVRRQNVRWRNVRWRNVREPFFQPSGSPAKLLFESSWKISYHFIIPFSSSHQWSNGATVPCSTLVHRTSRASKPASLRRESKTSSSSLLQ